MSATATLPSAKAVDDLLARGTVTVQQAIKEYGIGRSRLYELMQDGALAYSQIGARRLIPRVAIDRLIAAHLVGADDLTEGD